MRLNGSFVHDRRRDLGLTQRQLAKDVGVTSVVISNIESGDNHHAVTLDFVTRLAAALAVHPVHLLDFDADLAGHLVDDVNNDANADVDVDGDGDVDGDLVAHLGGLLFEAGVLTPVAALADALDVNLLAVEDALVLLEDALAPSGLVLHRRGGDVAIQPKAPRDSGALRNLIRGHHARRGMKLSEARVLRRVMDGLVDEANLSSPDRVALARLRRAGLVEGDRHPSLTSEVSSSLNPIE